jgi:hypothetical protein
VAHTSPFDADAYVSKLAPELELPFEPILGQFALLFADGFAAVYEDIDATFPWWDGCDADPVAASTATAVPAASAPAADSAATTLSGDMRLPPFSQPISKQVHLRRS